MDELLNIALRSLAVYVFIILAIRVSGKKELSQLSVVDLVFILLISNSVQNAMVGQNTSLQGGLVAALVLFLANFGLKKLMFKNSKIKDLIEAEPVILVKDGILDKNALNKSEITIDELEESVREHGVENISEVKLAVYDRWGARVFYSEDVLKGWDGTYKGQLCKNDIYTWVLSYKGLDRKTYHRSGHVSLLRTEK